MTSDHVRKGRRPKTARWWRLQQSHPLARSRVAQPWAAGQPESDVIYIPQLPYSCRAGSLGKQSGFRMDHWWPAGQIFPNRNKPHRKESPPTPSHHPTSWPSESPPSSGLPGCLRPRSWGRTHTCPQNCLRHSRPTSAWTRTRAAGKSPGQTWTRLWSSVTKARALQHPRHPLPCPGAILLLPESVPAQCPQPSVLSQGHGLQHLSFHSPTRHHGRVQANVTGVLSGLPGDLGCAQVGGRCPPGLGDEGPPTLHAHVPPQRLTGRVLRARPWTGRCMINRDTSACSSGYAGGEQSKPVLAPTSPVSSPGRAGPSPSSPRASPHAWGCSQRAPSAKEGQCHRLQRAGETRCEHRQPAHQTQRRM